MAIKSGAAIAKSWLSGIQNNTEKARAAVDAMTVNPMELAAAAEGRYALGTAKAAREGKFAAGCRSVSPNAWKKAYKEKGIPRMAEGAAQSLSLTAAFHDQHQPVAQASRDACRAAKAAGTMDGKARMLHNFDAMSAFSFTKPQR